MCAVRLISWVVVLLGACDTIQEDGQDGRHFGFYSKLEISKKWQKLKIFLARHIENNMSKHFGQICIKKWLGDMAPIFIEPCGSVFKGNVNRKLKVLINNPLARKTLWEWHPPVPLVPPRVKMLARVTLRSRHLTCQNLDIPKRRGQAMGLCTCIRQLLLMNCIAPLEVVLIITLLNTNGISGSLVTLSQVSPRCIAGVKQVAKGGENNI